MTLREFCAERGIEVQENHIALHDKPGCYFVLTYEESLGSFEGLIEKLRYIETNGYVDDLITFFLVKPKLDGDHWNHDATHVFMFSSATAAVHFKLRFA